MSRRRGVRCAAQCLRGAAGAPLGPWLCCTRLLSLAVLQVGLMTPDLAQAWLDDDTQHAHI